VAAVFSFVVVAHALAGAVALVSLWVPLLARKGGDAHRRAGRVYAYAMGAVSLTALVACALRVVEGDPERVRFAALLALVALLAPTVFGSLGIALWSRRYRAR
jgi:uncharacterized membrane protein